MSTSAPLSICGANRIHTSPFPEPTYLARFEDELGRETSHETRLINRYPAAHWLRPYLRARVTDRMYAVADSEMRSWLLRCDILLLEGDFRGEWRIVAVERERALDSGMGGERDSISFI